MGHWTTPYKLFGVFKRFGWDAERFLDWMYDSSIAFQGAQICSAISHKKKGKPLNYKKRSNVSSVGIKDFAFLIKKNDLCDYFEKRVDLKVIYLLRRNHFLRYVSLMGMKSSGLVSSEKVIENNFQLNVDVGDLIEKIKIYEAEESVANNILSKVDPNRVYTLDYDEYFRDSESISHCHKEIFRFLGVAGINVISNQKKLITRPVHELINNYQDVIVALENSGNEKYIPEAI